jgi:hypothetical protein
MSLRTFLSNLHFCAASLLLAAMPFAAHAAAPTAADIDAVQAAVGVDLLMAGSVGRLDGYEPFARIAAGKRACFKEQVAASINAEMDGRVVASFGTSERIGEFLAWSRSPAGTRFVAFLRAGVPIVLDGGPPPDFAAFRSTLTPDEVKDTARFLNTPAGLALRQFVSLPGDFLSDALFLAAAKTCGIDPQSGR